MITVHLQIDSQYQMEIVSERLIALAENALNNCDVIATELTIVITTDKTVQELNKQYRGFDTPTDVLSFESAYQNDDFFPVEESQTYLGDIVISAETARKQAQAAGHTTFEEIQLLTVHGILHLLGYDHLTPADKREMWQKQADILQLTINN